MRNIKFEAYDKKEKRIISHKELEWRSSICDFMDDFIDPFWEMTERVISDRVYRQYTEIKDDVGKAIYEGDIVKGKCPLGNEWVGEVRYLAPYYAVLGNKSHLLLSDLEKVRVIGNVFENPELLESDKQ